MPPAARLCKGGANVLAWNRTKTKAEPLSQVGEKVADRVWDLAARDTVFCMVSTWDDVKEVMFQLLEKSTKLPKLAVECSFISLAGSAELRTILEKGGIAYLAAPVSGNAKVIKAGKLSFVYSGPRKSFDVARGELRDAIGHLHADLRQGFGLGLGPVPSEDVGAALAQAGGRRRSTVRRNSARRRPRQMCRSCTFGSPCGTAHPWDIAPEDPIAARTTVARTRSRSPLSRPPLPVLPEIVVHS